MNELKFNSQICTSIRQSRRLLELGLNPETSDMCWLNISDLPASAGYTVFKKAEDKCNLKITPAWSLHRLLCMLDHDNADTFNIMPNLAYEDVIATISLRINCGAFNREYLSNEQKKNKTVCRPN